MNTLADQKSTFVTVVAWIFIVLSAMVLTSMFIQIIMFSFVFNSEFKDQIFSEAPWLAFFWMIMCLWVIFALITSIGLLRRRNWARILFMIGMVLLILYSIFCAVVLVFAPEFLWGDMAHNQQLQNNLEDDLFSNFRIAMAVFTLAFSALWAWMLTRFMSPKIKQEFLSKIQID